MYYTNQQNDQAEQITVCNIPFTVTRGDNGAVLPFPSPYASVRFSASCDVLFFLGMATGSDYCSEWWGQGEALYDQSKRLYLGDRLMRIRILFEDRTEELISVIFGVNAWNYNLYYGGRDYENIHLRGVYQEPFLSDPRAAALKDASLYLTENTEESAEKCTKWVFAYRLTRKAPIREIIFIKEEGKQTGVAVSAVTGLLRGGKIDPSFRIADQDFFLARKYYRDLDALSRRLYQYRDELPESVEKCVPDGYDAPDITFFGSGLADIFTNVYRVNMMDMAYHKVDDDGHSHTSTSMAPNFGSYIGFGTFSREDPYAHQVWTRDIGRTVMEMINAGYLARAGKAINYLHELLYYPSLRFKLPHWKRIGNKIAAHENDLFNEGKENDGHASVMLCIYTMYRKGGIDKQWLADHRKELKDAADYYLWQRDNPEQSGYSDILYSESETSTQDYGGYDLFSNLISSYALTAYARLFRVLEDHDYAAVLDGMAADLRKNVEKHFLMDHPRYGSVYTDTTDDAWTYEYKRMVDLLIHSDLYGYDIAQNNPVLRERMENTFSAQKEVFYKPASGRQMGYGQAYLTQAAMMLDRYEEFTECIEAAAMMCYHHTDWCYIVPEGVIMHGSGAFWYRNCDLGNAVQQAEIVKCARLLLGIDDIMPEEGIRLVPRLPLTWSGMSVENYPVTASDRSIRSIRFRYSRCTEGTLSGSVIAGDGRTTYCADWETDADVRSIRMGPFDSDAVTVQRGNLIRTEKIGDHYFAYAEAEK